MYEVTIFKVMDTVTDIFITVSTVFQLFVLRSRESYFIENVKTKFEILHYIIAFIAMDVQVVF